MAAEGAAIGAALGGVAGSVIAPGVGTVAGAKIGSQLGSAGQDLINARKDKKRAEAAMPSEVDPNQAANLAELNQKRQSIETGADFQSIINQARSTQAGTNDAMVRAGGGDASGTIQGILQAQRVAGNQINQGIAQGQQQQIQYNSMYGNLLNDIAQRKLELQMYKHQQALAQWAQNRSNANQAMGAAIGTALGEKKTPNTNTNTKTNDTNMGVSGLPISSGQSIAGGQSDLMSGTLQGGLNADGVQDYASMAAMGLGG